MRVNIKKWNDGKKGSGCYQDWNDENKGVCEEIGMFPIEGNGGDCFKFTNKHISKAGRTLKGITVMVWIKTDGSFGTEIERLPKPIREDADFVSKCVLKVIDAFEKYDMLT